MKKQLLIKIGQASSAGKKTINQDSFGAVIPQDYHRQTKGICLAVADGISSSDVSHIASQTAINSFLTDYYATTETWSVKTAGQRVLQATNSWLYAQTQQTPTRFNKDKGFITTFSALILKSHQGHLFHIGDSMICKILPDRLEPLTIPHQHRISDEVSYLTRGLGLEQKLNIDYAQITLYENDLFLLTTDGVYDALSHQTICDIIQANLTDLNQAASQLIKQALHAGSTDNLTVQLVLIKQLPDLGLDEIYIQNQSLTIPPTLEARSRFEHYLVIRPLYISSRSHVYLALDTITKQHLVLKTPSTEMRDNTQYCEHFLLEEWIGKRLNNPHLLKTYPPKQQRRHLYMVTEYIAGQTLKQWMLDNPKPSLATVRDIIEQIAKGLQAMHRQEMIHQDLRPNNIMIDETGTIKIIDFGATKVAGLNDIIADNHHIKGTLQYTAPEYFLGESGSARSDLFSLGVIAYQLITDQLPYRTAVSKATTKSTQNQLRYHHIDTSLGIVPIWIDQAIQKAVHPNPLKRYAEVSEFVYDLTHPNAHFIKQKTPPIIERNPVLVWQLISLCFAIIILAQIVID